MSQNAGEALARAIFGGEGAEVSVTRKRRPLSATQVEAAVMTMKELAEAYANGNAYKPGDIVTVRQGVSIKGAGEPHIVVETLDTPRYEWDEKEGSGSSGYGRRLDVRVLNAIPRDDGFEIATFWMESWTLEPFNG